MGSVCHKHPFFPVSGPVWPCFSRFWAKNHPKMVRFRAKLTFYTIRRTKTGFLRPYGPENGKTVFFCPYYCIWDQFHLYHFLIWGKKNSGPPDNTGSASYLLRHLRPIILRMFINWKLFYWHPAIHLCYIKFDTEPDFCTKVKYNCLRMVFPYIDEIREF